MTVRDCIKLLENHFKNVAVLGEAEDYDHLVVATEFIQSIEYVLQTKTPHRLLEKLDWKGLVSNALETPKRG